MTEASLKEKTAKGLFWGGIGNGAMQLLNLVFGIFLARLLSTTDYGMVAVLTIFSAMAGIFSESGFILALVNKKEVKHEEYNSVFWFNISIGASLYLILFLCAPFIADFYHTPELTRLARFQFLSFFIGSFGTAPTAYFFRNLMVKERSQIQIAANPHFGYYRCQLCLPWLGILGNCRTDRCVCQHQHYPALDILSLQAYFSIPLSPITGLLPFQR